MPGKSPKPVRPVPKKKQQRVLPPLGEYNSSLPADTFHIHPEIGKIEEMDLFSIRFKTQKNCYPKTAQTFIFFSNPLDKDAVLRSTRHYFTTLCIDSFKPFKYAFTHVREDTSIEVEQHADEKKLIEKMDFENLKIVFTGEMKRIDSSHESKVVSVFLNKHGPDSMVRFFLNPIFKENPCKYPAHYGKPCCNDTTLHCEEEGHISASRTCFGMTFDNTFCLSPVCNDCITNCAKCNMTIHLDGDCSRKCKSCHQLLCAICFCGPEYMKSTVSYENDCCLSCYLEQMHNDLPNW